MNVRLTQLDGKLPNLALMKLAHYHRGRGDTVRFTRTPFRHLDEPIYDRVYGSSIFSYAKPQTDRLMFEFPSAIVGGTGTGTTQTVEDVIGEHEGLDYSFYPKFTASIGFTQRGCRLSCKFCVVPKKEGRPRSTNTIADIWRGEPYPKQLILLDNDFFGQPEEHWRSRIAEIQEGRFAVSFIQGINVRAITDETAAALASIRCMDDSFKRRRLYTAWDNLKDEGAFFNGVDTLERNGIAPQSIMAYMLIGYDKNETWERIHHRFARMVARKIKPYPMVYGNRPDLKRFQRWAVTGIYRAGIPFDQYDPGARGPLRGDPELGLFS